MIVENDTARVVSKKGWDAMEKGQNLAALRVPRPPCAEQFEDILELLGASGPARE